MRSCILRSLLRARQLPHETPGGRVSRLLTYSWLKLTRGFSSNVGKNDHGDENDAGSKNTGYNLAAAMNTKYKVFHDEDADVIFDVSEEQQRILLEDLNEREEVVHDPYADMDLKHGVTGVFDIEQLVELLRRDKARNIFVTSVPKEYAYVDYVVIVTGSSRKHMNALATFVRKVYKLKKHRNESIPKIEGEHSKDWMALDLGNIALHIFSDSAREHYDLETLWTVGSQYDDKTNAFEEPSLMDQYNAFLVDLQPADDAR